MNKTPMVYTYGEAISSYKSKVNQKYPPQINNNNKNRNINQTTTRDRDGGRGRGYRGGGRGCHGNAGRGRQGVNNTRGKRGHPDAKWVKGIDGRQIEVHPSYDFPNHIWNNLPRQEQDKVRESRAKHKSNKRITSAVGTMINESNLDAQSIISTITEAARTRNVSQATIDPGDGNNNGSNDSNSSHNRSTIMGGRNEQTDLRTRNRNIRAMATKRVIGSFDSAPKFSEPKEGVCANNESDTNADTCCLGTNFKVLSYTNKTADVYPYDSTYKPIANVPIVTGATAYTDPESGKTYILVFNESLYYGTRLPHSLFNPNQIRQNGIDLWDNPYDKSHELSIDITDDLTVQLKMHGTKLVFQSRVPTVEELDTCPHIQMTSDRDWEPTSVQLGKVNMQCHNGGK